MMGLGAPSWQLSRRQSIGCSACSLGIRLSFGGRERSFPAGPPGNRRCEGDEGLGRRSEGRHGAIAKREGEKVKIRGGQHLARKGRAWWEPARLEAESCNGGIAQRRAGVVFFLTVP